MPGAPSREGEAEGGRLGDARAGSSVDGIPTLEGSLGVRGVTLVSVAAAKAPLA